LVIQVPNRFFYNWLEDNFVHLLKGAINAVLGQHSRLEYLIPKPKISTKPITNNANNTASKDDKYGRSNINVDEIKNPFVIPGIRKPKIPSNLKDSYIFANYIEGDCNRLARAAGLAIASRPGETSFNPLFIFGETGLGKSHLAHAIGNEVLRLHENKVVLYISAEHFTNQFIEAVQNNATNDFVNFHYHIDLLIIDDIHYFNNKLKTQDIFFHIFNQMHQRGKQIILTSDKPPKELQGIEERLISRFKWGLSADLQIPDLETRMAIIQSKIESDGIELPYNVTEFISYNIKSNIRELEGAVISLLAQAALNNRDIDMDLARDVIKHFVNNISKEITLDFIQKIVAEHFDVSVDMLKEKTRKRIFVIARQISMYLAKELTNNSLKTIGDFFGGRDHSTVIHSCRTVQDLLETDPEIKDSVNELIKKIKLNAS
jgi:chromosomal replication initiator protein